MALLLRSLRRAAVVSNWRASLSTVKRSRSFQPRWAEHTDDESVPPEPTLSPLATRWADMRSPQLWYPSARSMRRRVVLHLGPTNSGKTFAALERLRRCSGVYCGPLRLLAWEVAERLNDSGTPCSLVTGQECEEVDGARHVSCTVEMADVNADVEVLVLDEVQMIGDESRGWAWTRVLLGARAREIHACGDAAALDLVLRICALTGDALEVHRYDRLSPLEVASTPMRSVGDVRRGDCVVAFSRRELFEHKRTIEERTGLRCGVIYGSLPPAVRREQATRFNGEGGNDVLVATDAIGLGLNLAIGRVIFARIDKFDGTSRRPLSVSEMKQIGGRAGRFGSSFPTGVVTCVGTGGQAVNQIATLRKAMRSDTPRVRLAGLLPTHEQLELFSAACWDDRSMEQEEEEEEDISAAAQAATDAIPFSQILKMFFDNANVDRDRFFVCDFGDLINVACVLDDIKIPFRARLVFCFSPVDVNDALCVTAIRRYADRFVVKGRVRVGLRVPDTPPSTPVQLRELESAHAVFDLYLWLARRFPHEFVSAAEARSAAERTQTLIQNGLEQMGETAVARMHARQLRAADPHGADTSDSGVSEYLRSMVVDDEQGDETMPAQEDQALQAHRRRRDRLLQLMDVATRVGAEKEARRRARAKRAEDAYAAVADAVDHRSKLAVQASRMNRAAPVDVRQYMRMQKVGAR